MQFNLNGTPATLLNFGGTAQKEIEICFQSSWRVVSNLGLNHMISIQLVAIATFCFATRNTYVLRVFCAVQLECHTGDFA